MYLHQRMHCHKDYFATELLYTSVWDCQVVARHDAGLLDPHEHHHHHRQMKDGLCDDRLLWDNQIIKALLALPQLRDSDEVCLHGTVFFILRKLET